MFAIGCVRHECRLVDPHAHLVLQLDGALPVQFNLAATCRRWRVVVTSTPRFWTYLYINARAPSISTKTQTMTAFPNPLSISSYVGAVGAVLKYGGAHDIILEISPMEWLYAAASGVPAVDHFCEVIGILVGHCHRWKTLKLTTFGAQIKSTHWVRFLPIAHRIRKLERLDIGDGIQPLASAQDRWLSKTLFIDAPALRSVRVVWSESYQIDLPWSQIADLDLKSRFVELGTWRSVVETMVAKKLTWEAYVAHPDVHTLRRQTRKKPLPPPRNEHVRHLILKSHFTPIVLPSLESLTISQCTPRVFDMVSYFLKMSNASLKTVIYDAENPFDTFFSFSDLLLQNPCCAHLLHYRHVIRSSDPIQGDILDVFWAMLNMLTKLPKLKTLHILLRPPCGGGSPPSLTEGICSGFWKLVKLNRQQEPWNRKALALFSRIGEEDDVDAHIRGFCEDLFFPHIKQTAQISDVKISVRSRLLQLLSELSAN